MLTSKSPFSYLVTVADALWYHNDCWPRWLL